MRSLRSSTLRSTGDCRITCVGLQKVALSRLSTTTSCLADQKNRKADHIRNYCHADDFGRENQPTRNIDEWIDSEEDRQQGDNEDADRGDSQPKSCILSHSARVANRQSGQNERNDSIETVEGIVPEVKCLQDAG